MPCSKRFAAALEETETTPDGVRMYTWRAVRRQQLRDLRQPVRWVVFFMALIEVQRVGLTNIIFQGKHDTKAAGPEDYGISHAAGYIIAWLFACVYCILWVPLFSWWWHPSSNDSSTDNPEENRNRWIDKFNMVILPLNIALYLLTYVVHLVRTFIYVGPKPYSPSDAGVSLNLNTKKAWGIRALLFSGICTSLAFGKYVFTVLESFDLAKVKFAEYLIIVVPIQINLGILLASAVQFKAEKRQARKMAERKNDVEVAGVDEKQELLVQE